MESITISTMLDHLSLQIGDNGLIIQAKALEASNKTRMSLGEIERLLILFSNNEFNFKSELHRIKFLSVLLYLQAEYDAEKAPLFLAKVEQWQNSNKNILRSSVSIDQLHLIFNIIEFHDKFKLLNAEKLKLLGVQISTYEKLEKPFEEYVLYKYYSGILKYYLKDYQIAKISVMDIVIDLTEEIENKADRTPLVDYIELKNSILNLRILENENDTKEVLTNIECLYETYSKKDDFLAIQLSMKMCDIHLTFYEFDKSIQILNQIYKKIKRQILFVGGNYGGHYGGDYKFPEFAEICLSVIARVIYCGIMIGKTDEASKFIKKLEKIINLVKDCQIKNRGEIANLHNMTEHKEVMLAKYHFYLLIYKNICKYGNIDKTELNNSINAYRIRFKNQINSEDDIITNIYAFNSSDVLARNFFEKVNMNMSIIQNNKLLPVKYVSLFFSLYNQISILTKNISTDSNLKKQYEYVEKMRNCSKSVIDYINKYIDNTYELRYIFTFPYFKEMLIKVYISYIYTYYFTKDFSKALEMIEEFEEVKSKLNLNDGASLKHYAGIIKLKGDILFKMADYVQACNCYSRVVQIYTDLVNHSQSMAMVIFDLGLSYFYAKEYALAKKNLSLAKNKFDLLNSINQNQYSDKVKQVNTILQHLSPIFQSYD